MGRSPVGVMSCRGDEKMKTTMRCVWMLTHLLAMVATVIAQQPSNHSLDELKLEDGAILNGRYSNECLGFSLPIPVGWKVSDQDGKAKHLSSAKDLALLLLGNSSGLIFVNAWDATARNQATSAQDFVSNAVRDKVNSPTTRRELIRDAFAVSYGGKQFFRSDYKTSLQNRDEYWAYVYTKFRGYFIGGTVMQRSKKGLDEAANSLSGISFEEDQVNSRCVMGPEDVGSTSKSSSGFLKRVRVSSGVSEGLLVNKVQPRYPEKAREAGVQGQVALQAEIDDNGRVQDVKLISGDPILADAAMAAVKQWQYKPYLYNDEPVAVETQVFVNFKLNRR
jgi:TonB family protein